MRTMLAILGLLYCCTAHAVNPVQNASITSNGPSGFAFEMVLARLSTLEHHFIEKQLQADEKTTVLSSQIDKLVKSIENLAWSAQNTDKTVTLLGLSDQHMRQNFTTLQRDLTELLANQKLLVTTHQFGKHILKSGCNATHLPAIGNAFSTPDGVSYRSCSMVPFRESGVYSIRPETPFKQPLTVLCDQEYESGGWIVIQHRYDGSTNFYREWVEYREGFGNLDGEFWLGLESIHRLTRSARHELVVLLEDFEGNRTVARYDHFAIGSQTQKYALINIDGYSGTAGDSLSDMKGMAFSTHDADSDTSNENCAVTYSGAWWYRSCHSSNLNGKYLRGETKEFATSMVWKSFRGYHYSLKSSKMMIRPKLMK